MAGLSTHVLDTSLGKPAAALQIDLYNDSGLLSSKVTNNDGRTDEPLIAAGQLQTGRYALHFHAGDYLRARGAADGDILFLDVVVIQFGIAQVDQHYHVPLLLSPYGYSTYRGS